MEKKNVTGREDSHISFAPENYGKSKTAAALLAFFLGGLGIHRYYLGYTGKGVAQTVGGICRLIGLILLLQAIETEIIALLVLAVPLNIYASATNIWAFVDFIRILTGSLGVSPEVVFMLTEGRNANSVPKSEPSPSDSIPLSEKLDALHNSGILSDEEYAKKKTELQGKA